MEKDPEKQQKFINDVIEKCEFLQNVHLWPRDKELNYKSWLENFTTTEEKYIASHILSFFIYYSKDMVNQLVVDAMNNACEYFKKKIPNCNNSFISNFCYFSFIKSNKNSLTDSGYFFMRILKSSFNITDDRIITFEELGNRIRNGEQLNIIILDDFLGSGQQFNAAMKYKYFLKNKNFWSLGSFINDSKYNNYKITFIPLIANEIGYNRLKEAFPTIDISPVHILGKEYNLFEESCICWHNDNELFNKGVKLIEKISKSYNMPNKGDRLIDIRGYQDQGLAISFDHGTPDATIAMFFYKGNGWKHLVNKNYNKKKDEC